MNLNTCPTADLAHQAKHAMTEELALISIREFLIRPDAPTQMFIQIIEGTRYTKVRFLAETGLIANKSVSSSDLVWLLTHTSSDEVALKALWTLASFSDVSPRQWGKVVCFGRSKVVRLRAQEYLVAHPEADSSDFTMLLELEMPEEIKKLAQFKLSLLSGNQNVVTEDILKWIISLARLGKQTIVCLRAQEMLSRYEQASLDDLLWLDENGLTDDIKSAARLTMSTRF